MTTTSRRMAKTRGAITANEIAECLAPMHPCKRCTRPIDDRYPFRVCVRCSLDDLQALLESDGYYEAKRSAAYERLAAAGLLKEK